MSSDNQSVYRGFTPRPLMGDIRLFHGYMAAVPTVDEAEFQALEATFNEPFTGITEPLRAAPGGLTRRDTDCATTAACGADRRESSRCR